MAELWVGASRDFTTLSAAVNAASAGDTIFIDAGTYENDFVVIHKELTLVGVGGDAHFTATQQIGNGKAIIVANASLTIENLEFSGATVADQNGAGIRYQKGTLVVRDSSFHDNENGILGAAHEGGRIEIYNSSFVDNGFGDGRTHGIYAGNIDTLIVRDSLFEATYKGSHIKSRADNAEITGNRLIDGDGKSNYGVDLSNAGNAVIVGNWFEQAADTSNRHMIAYGPEGDKPGTLTVAGNTMINFRHLATGVRNWTDNEVSVTDNTFVDISEWIHGSATASGNIDAELADVRANAAPVAGDDSASGAVDDAVDIDVLANDSDGDGGTLDIAAVGAAAHGSVVDNGDGTLTYTPEIGFVGDDSFDYWVVDRQGGFDRATVTVSVSDTPIEPPAEPPVEPPATALAPDEIAGLNLWFDASQAANVVDGDGDGLVDRWVDRAGAHDATAGGSRQPTPTGNGLAFDGGSDGFGIANASDLNAGTLSLAKTLTLSFTTGGDVASRQVLYEQGGAIRGLNIYVEDGEVHVSGWNLAEQVWGPATVSAGIAAETTYVVSLRYDGDAGTLSGNLNGASMGTATGVAGLYKHTGAIGLGYMKNDSYFADGAAKGDGLYFAGVLHEVAFHDRALTDAELDGLQEYLGDKWLAAYEPPPNQAPVADDDAAETLAGNAVAVDVLANDSDPDDDALVIGAIGAAGNGSVADNGDGTLTYTPDAGFVGDDSFTYTVDDGAGGTDTATVTVTVSVTAPPAGLAPDAIADLIVWFDGADAGSLVDSDNDGAVNRWTDRAGNHDATAGGSRQPSLAPDGADFDGGNDGMAIADAVDLNSASLSQGKTLTVSFTAGDDVASRQVLYEQGGWIRGLNLYVEDGEVHVSGWNLAEQAWGPATVSGAVVAGGTYVVSLRFDASAGTLSGHLNGVEMGTATGVAGLYQHTGDIGLGYMRQDSYFADGAARGDGFSFDGILHEAAFHNRALADTELGGLHDYLVDKWDADVLIG